MVKKTALKKTAAVALTAAMLTATSSGTSVSVATAASNPEREEFGMQISRQIASEGMVLLKNENQVLPLKEGDSVAVFGRGACMTCFGGTGSGNVNNKRNVSFYEGMKELFPKYGITLDSKIEELYSYAAPEKNLTNDFVTKEIEESEIQAAAERNNKAVFVITRTGSENADRVLSSDEENLMKAQYNLYDAELKTLELLNKYFDQVVVIYNTSSTTDISAVLETGTDAILASWLPGSESGYALVDVLTGAVNPSGKLNDTWAYHFEDHYSSKNFANWHHDKQTTEVSQNTYENIAKDGLIPFIASNTYKTYGLDPMQNAGLYHPAQFNLDPALNGGKQYTAVIDENTPCVYYEEGIYVGYRYFDTFGVDVAYEFGYGISYTTFDISEESVSIDEDKNEIVVTAKVTNTGDLPGKEVVQVYFSAPDSEELEKPYQELAGFQKTKELAPGESETVTIHFSTSDLSSYSEEKAAYIVDPGQYLFRVGNSSRNTKVVAKAQLQEQVLTEQLTNQLGMTENAKETLKSELSKEGYLPITYEAEKEEIEDAPSFSMTKDSFTIVEASEIPEIVTEELENAYPETTLKLQAVYDGTITVEEFVSQLDTEELLTLSTGCLTGQEDIATKSREYSGSGGITNSLPEYGIPSIVMADGPAGLRITREIKDETGTVIEENNATRFPNASATACSWNVELLEVMGDMIGREMIEFDIDWWLAPGINIHRNPLIGRNFEYYSEDPLLAGKEAAAICKYIQSQKDEAGTGGGVCVKHFALNNEESNRKFVDTIASERAIREIYLKPFEITVKEADPYSIMPAYNRVNGQYCAASRDLMTNITRGEWGFDGVYVTDWRYQATVGATFSAGCELLMPYSQVDYFEYCVENEDPMDTVSVAQLQENVCRMMKAVLKTSSMSNYIDTTAVVEDETIVAGDTVDVTVMSKEEITDVKLFDTNGKSANATAEKAEDGRWKVSFTAKETENEILLVYTQKNGIFENSGATISYKASAASEADKQEQETVTAEIISTGEIHSGDEVTVKITAPSYVEFVKLSDGTDELETSSTRKVKLGKAVFEIKFTADKSQTLNILTASSEEIYEESGISFEIEVK